MDEFSIILTAFVGLTAYWFNELEQACMRNKFEEKSDWWNTRKSWKLKWKQPMKKQGAGKWYHFGITPSHVERFPYSSTILVFLTDGEHFFQWCKFRLVDFIVVYLAWPSWELIVAWFAANVFARAFKEMFTNWD